MEERPWLAIVAPAYNEEAVIEGVIREWAHVLDRSGRSWEIVITDDGSSDRTGSILASLQNELATLRVVTNNPNGGYGFALSRAIAASTADFVMTMDSDGQFDASHYTQLFDRLEQSRVDLVSGFRRGKKDTLFRVVADRFLNVLVRLMFGLSLRDTNCAQKLGRGDCLRSIVIESMGYPTPTELVIKAKVLGFTVTEEGVTHAERAAGMSKLHPLRTAYQFLLFLCYLRLRITLFRRRIIQRL